MRPDYSGTEMSRRLPRQDDLLPLFLLADGVKSRADAMEIILISRNTGGIKCAVVKPHKHICWYLLDNRAFSVSVSAAAVDETQHQSLFAATISKYRRTRCYLAQGNGRRFGGAISHRGTSAAGIGHCSRQHCYLIYAIADAGLFMAQ